MKTMVIVDDEPIVISGIHALIERMSYDIQIIGTANNGVSGYEVIRSLKPDIAVVDIRMPETDGLSLIEALNDMQTTAFIVISGFQDFKYAQTALRLGVVDYIDKPITLTKFGNAIVKAEKYLNLINAYREVGDDPFLSKSQIINSRKDKIDGNIAQIKDYIDKNHSQQLSLSWLGEKFNINPAYLSTKFREVTGENFSKYLTKLRIRHAQDLLAKGYKVTDIYQEVGYLNYRYFCDVFKKETGLTPSEYRRQKEQKT